MTAKNYDQCLAWVLQEEGGYVNHPADPGGATNKGVTQAVYDDWRHRKGQAQQSVRMISDDEVKAIYRANYWAKVRGDDLPSGVDYAVFDLAVNSGISRAARFLQASVGTEQDGVIGPKTIGEIGNPVKIVNAICDKRQDFLEGLSTFPTFGKGWTARVARVRERARELA